MSTESNTHVELNPDVGHHLLNFLHGQDAIAFLEAGNDSAQFCDIATTFDNYFVEYIKKYIGQSRIRIHKAFFCRFARSFDINEESLLLMPRRYSTTISPCHRMFVHPCFGNEAFARMCRYYQTSLFKCYARLLSYTSPFYDATFALIDYAPFRQALGSARALSDHEMSLFNGKIHKSDSR